MDLVYNVIKRAVSKQIYISPNDLTKKRYINEDLKPEKNIKEFYKNIAKNLKENDDVYFSEEEHPRFSFRLKESCIYKFFVENPDNGVGIHYGEISEKGICLSIATKTDVIIKHNTLGKLLDSIMSRDMYVVGEGEYMMKIRGALFMYTDIVLSSNQASTISSAIIEPIFEFMTLIGDNNVNQIALAKSISKFADEAIKQIKEILNVE